MKKIIWIIGLFIMIHILEGKGKVKTEIYTSRTFETVTTENVKSSLDKYFSDFEFQNRKFRLLMTDDSAIYDYIRGKLLSYDNIGVLFIPKNKRMVCQKEKFGITSAFFMGAEQADTLIRNNSICTKKAVDKILTLPGKFDMTEVESLHIDFTEKVYIDKKNLEKIFK